MAQLEMQSERILQDARKRRVLPWIVNDVLLEMTCFGAIRAGGSRSNVFMSNLKSLRFWVHQVLHSRVKFINFLFGKFGVRHFN